MPKDTKIVSGKLERFGKFWDYTEVDLAPDSKFKKPVIDETKVLDSDEKAVVEHVLKMEGLRLIHAELKPHKNDYKGDDDRGSVEYTPKCRNYSRHKVSIPDGTTLKEVNFSQAVAHTVAITGRNLTFIGCNLNNVEIDPSWRFENSLTIHSKVETVGDEIINYIEKNGEWVEVERTPIAVVEVI